MVAKERKPPELQLRTAIFVLALESRDVVVDELRGGSVVANHDEAWWHRYLALLPQFECLFVVSVQRIKRRLQLRWQFERIESARFPTPLLRHLVSDVFPKIAEHRHLATGNIVCDGY